MAKYDGTTIEIINWETYNPRKDVRRPYWYRFTNGFFEDPQFFEFTPQDLWVLTYLLSQASKKQSGSVRVHWSHAERVGRIKEKDFAAAIEKLLSIQFVRITLNDPYADVTQTSRERHATQQDITEHNKTEHNTRSALDFESLYRKYPRKLGKEAGIKKARKEITDPELYLALSGAIDRFAAHHREKGTEAQFIPYFSTFMASWREWLDPETGTAEAAVAKGEIDWAKVNLA